MQPSAPHDAAVHSSFLPHGFCYLWDPPLLWTHFVSDLLIGLSYVTISFSLAYLIHKARRDIPFSLAFVAFGLFIITCGLTHFMEIWTLWRPVYWTSAVVKVVTAAASVATAVWMPFLVPKAHATITDARLAREREVAAARVEALAEQNARLEAQALELEREREEAHRLAADLERANAELRRVAADARRHLEELEATYRSAPVGLGVLDRELRFVRINESLAAMNGLPAEAHIGRTVREVVPDLAPGAEPALRRVLETGEPAVGIEITGETAADPGVTHHWVEAWHPLRDGVGEVVGINVVAEDVTERRRAEGERERLLAEAKAARVAAEAANHAKSEFLARMSHELRTPLNAIQGHVQLVEMGVHGAVTDAQREALGRVTRAQRHLLGLIDDILDLSRLERGTLEVELHEIDLAEVLPDIAAMIAPQVAARGLAFDVRPPRAQCAVWGDRQKLAQVLLNLVGNALKFTAPGGAICVDVAASDMAADVVHVRVQDTGVGIAPEQREAIFQPFVQGQGAYTREVGGAGLGLAISRDLAQAMGGDLRVESERGKGSTFILDLRRTTAAGEPTERRVRDERRELERRSGVDRREEGADEATAGDAQGGVLHPRGQEG